MKRHTLWSCAVLCACILTTQSIASASALNDTLPIDPDLRIGKLENGFTYIIRKNEMPKERVELKLAVNAGSILEDVDQLGLAHFCEHMAFNGSEHFEKNELVSYLQSLGIRFGAELNAFTSFDETVYRLTIPTDKPELMDSGLLVMRDWATGLTFSDEEIDKERGVIMEEWRLGRGADQRMRDQYFPVLFGGSHYAERLPIGTKDVIENAPYDTLRRFYKDWYRPDLMALIVVGDIDVAEMEARIKEQFSDLNAPEQPRERLEFFVPAHDETKTCVVTDAEASQTIVQVFYPHEVNSVVEVGDFLDELSRQCFVQMLNQRLREKTQEADPPYVFAGSSWNNKMLRNTAAYSSFAMVAEDGVERALRTIMTENKRVAEYGFVAEELERQKANILKGFEKAYLERDKNESERLGSEYVAFFLKQVIPTSPEFDLKVVKEHFGSMQLDTINQLAKQLITKQNRVIVVTGPEKVKAFVDDAKLQEILLEVDQQEIAVYEDKLSGSEILPIQPTPGKVVSTEDIPEIDTKHLKLSNGMNVYLKHTMLKNDQVLVKLSSLGGSSLYEDKDDITSRYVPTVVSLCGFGDFSPTDLSKLLAGKTVSLNPNITLYKEEMNGQTRPEDLETFFQLLHLAMTTPRESEDAFKAFQARMSAYVQNMKENPQVYYQDQNQRILSQNHPRGPHFPTLEEIGNVDLQRSLEIYRDRFSDADDFNLTIVGNFDEIVLIPLLEKYVASLPSKPGSETWEDLGIRPAAEQQTHNIYKGQDPKSITVLHFEKPVADNLDQQLILNGFEELLNIKLIEVIREEMSGVYSIRANLSSSRIPYENAYMDISFPSSPENVEPLVARIFEILEDIKSNGASDEDIQKVRETMKRTHETKMQKNGFWLGRIDNCAKWGIDFSLITDLDRFDMISSDSIQEALAKCVDFDQYTQISLYPESMKDSQE